MASLSDDEARFTPDTSRSNGCFRVMMKFR